MPLKLCPQSSQVGYRIRAMNPVHESFLCIIESLENKLTYLLTYLLSLVEFPHVSTMSGL